LDILKELGMIAFSARIRRLSDVITQGILDIYKENHLNFDLRYAPILLILKQKKIMISSEISEALGYTKSAISQTLFDMMRDGLLIEQADRLDRRKKQLKLTSKGKLLIKKLEPVWSHAEQIFINLQEEAGCDLLEHLSALEECLEHKGIVQRYREIQE
jgi:DNA-binding MarR family transcriptional regulator